MLWNAALALVGLVIFLDIVPLFARNLTRVFSSSFDDVYAVASLARFLGLFTPFLVLFAFSTLFFTRRHFVVRLPWLVPIFAFLMHSIPPRITDCVLLGVYLVVVSTVLVAGVGWPVVARDGWRRFRSTTTLDDG